MSEAFAIRKPGTYRDRLGRTVQVEGVAQHNPSRWMGIAGDGKGACWESSGVMEQSLPSDIDIVQGPLPAITATGER